MFLIFEAFEKRYGIKYTVFLIMKQKTRFKNFKNIASTSKQPYQPISRDHVPQSLYYCLFAPHTCGVVLWTHPIQGESHIERNKNSLELFSRLFEESPAWFCFHLHAMIRACTYHSAKFVKPQQWPTPSESIAIYCVRKLVSCITHLQSCANVDIWNKKKKLRTVA